MQEVLWWKARRFFLFLSSSSTQVVFANLASNTVLQNLLVHSLWACFRAFFKTPTLTPCWGTSSAFSTPWRTSDRFIDCFRFLWPTQICFCLSSVFLEGHLIILLIVFFSVTYTNLFLSFIRFSFVKHQSWCKPVFAPSSRLLWIMKPSPPGVQIELMQCLLCCPTKQFYQKRVDTFFPETYLRPRILAIHS